MKQLTRLIWLFSFTWLLVACGGGGSLQRGDTIDSGDQPPPSSSAPVMDLSIELFNSAGEVSTELSDGAPLTVRVTVTEDGSPKSNELVTFSLSQSDLAEFGNDTGTALTNAEGVAEINLLVGSLSGSGTVSASIAGDVSKSAGFVSSGLVQLAPSSLELFASAIQMASSGSDEIEIIAVVKSEQNILLPDVTVNFAASSGASLSVVNPQTANDGTARALLSTANNPENRVITVTATSGALQETVSINVTGTEVNINGPSSVILNDSAPITLVLSDSDGNGIGGQTIDLSASAGQLDNIAPVTNSNGQVTVNYTATQSGSATISASALNSTNTFNVNVQQDDFSFVALPTEGLALNTPHEIQVRWFKNNSAFANGDVTVTTSRGEVSVGGVATNRATTDANGIATFTVTSAFAGPASVSAVGTDSSNSQVTARGRIEFVAQNVDSVFVDATPDLIGPEGQTSTITAVVRDEDGNLVKGKTVNFRLFADSTGGSVSPNSAITDSNGIASTVYTSSAVSSQDGVTIEAEADGITALTSLTVGDRAFDISIGTGNIIESPDNATYKKDFAIFVSDAAGRPIRDAQLTATSTPPLANAYTKGFWVWLDEERTWAAVGTVTCPSEDVNGNGRLDAGEDTNGDGQLTPGNVAVVSFIDGVTRTDANGQANISLRYARQYGAWVRTIVSVSGQSSGTESSEQQTFGLVPSAADLSQENVSPPANPFGSSFNCNDTE
uniref:Ig-like domain-containing protein n=1 Tax=Ningiella ruwaisensis TaxID=2364274 RepID=UPI00109F7BB2|nr:Ig-like domain-containing protein [Ningiella ruwaisensis]